VGGGVDDSHDLTDERAARLEDRAWTSVTFSVRWRLREDLRAESIADDELTARLEPDRAALTAEVSAATAAAARAEERLDRLRLSPTVARRILVVVVALGLVGLVAGVASLLFPSTGSVSGVAFAAGAGVLGLVPIIFLRLRAAQRTQREADDAYSALTDQLLGLVLPRARQLLAELGSVPFNQVSVRSTPGLSELIDPSLEVETKAREQLVDVLGNLETASLGIAGPRGAGKTTLVAAACEGRVLPRRSPLGVVVPAPMKYESVEFIPYLFNEVCLRIIPPDDEERARFPRPVLALSAAYLGSALIALGLLIAFGSIHISAGTLAATAPLVATGVLVVIAAASMVAGRRTWRLDSDAARAVKELRAVRYRESVGKGWSGEAGPSLGFRIGGKREVWSSEEPPTLPDLVARYKRFVGDLARKERPVMIGIDELDKMPAEDVPKILNDIKILFGVRHCYYLVSVSEDALSAFERRGMPIRDVFDSSFDDVLRVAPLDISQSRQLIQRRAVGLGEGAQLLCHCLSGGLPRELVRCARAVVGTTNDGKVHLDGITSALVTRRIEMVERAAAIVATKAVPPNGRQPILIWLRSLPPMSEAAALEARWDIGSVVEEVISGDLAPQQVESQRSVVSELAVAAYHADAVRRFFTGLAEDDFRRAVDSEHGRMPALELLALAQQQMSVSLESAWTAVDRFRERVDLVVADYPF
jgi:hypothetical protein